MDISEVEAARAARYAKGMKTYRPNGGDFVGCPIEEGFEEVLDLITYLEIGVAQKKLPEKETFIFCEYLRGGALWLGTILESAIPERAPRSIAAAGTYSAPAG